MLMQDMVLINIEQTQINILSRMSIKQKFLLLLKRARIIYEEFRVKAFETKNLIRKVDEDQIAWDPPGLLSLLKTLRNVDWDSHGDLSTDNEGEFEDDDDVEIERQPLDEIQEGDQSESTPNK